MMSVQASSDEMSAIWEYKSLVSFPADPHACCRAARPHHGGADPPRWHQCCAPKKRDRGTHRCGTMFSQL